MKKENSNSILIKCLAVKPVAFNPALGRMAGSALAGLFMSQLLYWWGKGYKKDCVFKTIVEFERETCLTRSEQDRAIKKWKNLGVLEVKRMGIPQKRHFFLNTEKLANMLNDYATEKGIDGYYMQNNEN